MWVSDSLCRPFGFLFIYGIYGEGENLGELMESMWRFTSRVGEGMRDCRVVITELGFGDILLPTTFLRQILCHVSMIYGTQRDFQAMVMKILMN
ncbi:hypothetical protein GYH30_042329 [Glycine max]|nr:hypothetical protein GYH30_042329 [Glycine max]